MDGEVLIRDQQPSATPAEFAPPPPDASAGANPETEPNKPYPPPVGIPTQLGPKGIRFDFNQGARGRAARTGPRASGGSGCATSTPATSCSRARTRAPSSAPSKRFFVRFSVEVWELDEAGTATSVLSHEYDARDRDVLIQFPIGTLGDILAWFPYAARFAEVHGCRLTCAMSGLIIPLLRDAYPAIRFVTHEELVEQKLAGDGLRHLLPRACSSTTRTSSTSRPISAMSGCTARPATSSGVDPAEEPPRLACRTKARRSPSPMSASPCRARRRARTGRTRMAGARWSRS